MSDDPTKRFLEKLGDVNFQERWDELVAEEVDNPDAVPTAQEKRAVEQMETLASLENALGALGAQHKRNIEMVIPQQLREILDLMEAEHREEVKIIEQQAQKVEDEIKALVLQVGHTVEGDYKQAVWNKGRTSVDTKAVRRLAKTIPEVADCIGEGEPYVSIRKKR